MGDELQGLLDAGLREWIGGRPGLAQRVARVPNHVIDVAYGLLRSDQRLDDGVSPVRSGRHQVAGRDQTRDLGSQGGLVNMVGPAHVSRLDSQMELIADIVSGIPVARCRSVPGSGVRVGGIALAPVGADAEYLGRLDLGL